MDMLNHLLASQVDHSLVRKLKVYTEPACSSSTNSVIWPSTSRLRTCSTRSSPPATATSVPIITTNTAFSDWGNILYNTTIAAAIADRLVENSEIFLLGGESLRKAQKSPPPPTLKVGSSQAPLCAIAHHRRSPAGNPSTALPMGRGLKLPPAPSVPTMFNFSANHLFLLSRKEYRSCAVLLVARPRHPARLSPA
jgi:hypothetical protein